MNFGSRGDTEWFDKRMNVEEEPRRHVRLQTPLGDFLVAARGSALVGGYFDDQQHLPKPAWFGSQVDCSADAILRQAQQELREYLAYQRQKFDVPVRPEGTSFQQRVWQRLCTIPFGKTTTYGALTAGLSPDGIATPGLAQGVGHAVGHNPISLFIPCHRVLGSDGSLTGYAGGLDRKRWLLSHEESPEAKESRLF